MFHVAIYGLTFQTSNESWIFPLLRQQTKATLSGLGIGAVAVVPYFLFALKTTRPFDVPHAINLSIASFLGATYDGLLFLPVVFNLIVLTRFKRLPEQPELPDDDARILSTMALLFCLIALVPISLGPPIEPRQNIVAALASITAAVFSWQSSARPKVALFSGAIALVIIALDIVKSKPLAQIFAPGL